MNDLKAVPAMTDGLQGAFQLFGPDHKPHRLRELKAAFCTETARQCIEQYKDCLLAIVLTGSLARDEATFIEERERWSLLGDAEFILIFNEHASLPSSADLDPLCRRIRERLLQHNIQGNISLGDVCPTYLRKLKPHIFAYELRVCGQVIWGEPQILSLIPAFSASDIPLEDAWRLLCNRMIEQLEVVEDLADYPVILPPRVHYRTIKLYLDMATSYLLFAGAYAPTYRGRAERLRVLADNAVPDDRVPFPLQRFAERVTGCTLEKLLRPDQGGLALISREGEPGVLLWEEAAAYARQLWRWELVRLTGARPQLSDLELLKRWMRLQPVSERLRGWLYVLRKRGWHRSWRHWTRWGGQAWRASPRYQVYAAASEVFFQLPYLVGAADQSPELDFRWEKLQRWLPVLQKGKVHDERLVWRQLASDTVWNYHEFLAETRA